MQKRDTFGSFHPVIIMGYFIFVILITMFVLQPWFLCISFVSAFIYSVYLNGFRAVKFNLLAVLPMMFLAVVINVAFNHAGMTILLYVNDNPITLESTLYGLCAALMFGSVIIWFSCYNAVMTTDKFIYLFGKIIPALSLVMAMTLRFVPRFKRQIHHVTMAQKGIGRDPGQGNLWRRIRNGMSILSIMMTWSLENAVDTADSMHSRGYGLKGRSAYALYRMDKRDVFAGIGSLFMMIIVVAAVLTRVIYVRFFPDFFMGTMQVKTLVAMAAFLILCFLPIIINLKEDLLWRSLKSKI